MQKLLIALGLVLVLAMGASAQMEETGLTAKGFKVGLNMANLTGDIDGNAMKMGIAGGVFMTYTFSPGVAMQPEVMYVMHGTKEDGGDGKIKLDYIDVPILFKYSFPTEGNFKPNLFAGPMVGLLMSAKMDDNDIKDGMKDINFGAAFGIGATMQMETMAVTMDARYTLGLTNTLDIPDEVDVSWKTGDISIMLGLAF